MNVCIVPGCGRPRPSYGHYVMHKKRGEVVRMLIPCGWGWGMAWVLPESKEVRVRAGENA